MDRSDSGKDAPRLLFSDGVESDILSPPGLRNGEIFFSVSRGRFYDNPTAMLCGHGGTETSTEVTTW